MTAARPGAPADGSPAFARLAAELAQPVERLGLGRVAEVMGLRPDDVEELLEGRVGVSRAALDRPRRARG